MAFNRTEGYLSCRDRRNIERLRMLGINQQFLLQGVSTLVLLGSPDCRCYRSGDRATRPVDLVLTVFSDLPTYPAPILLIPTLDIPE